MAATNSKEAGNGLMETVVQTGGLISGALSRALTIKKKLYGGDIAPSEKEPEVEKESARGIAQDIFKDTLALCMTLEDIEVRL